MLNIIHIPKRTAGIFDEKCKKAIFRTLFVALILICTPGTQANAQINLPGPADIDRISPEPFEVKPDREDIEIDGMNALPDIEIPDAAKQITFFLKDINVEGVSAFKEDEIRQLFTQYLDTEVSLALAWEIAGKITSKYRESGYFLTRAYVPAQEIQNGVIRINVVEGYIGVVEVPNNALSKNRLLLDLKQELLQQRPVTSSDLEQFLLLANDIPGWAVFGTLYPLKDAPDPVVGLKISAKERKGRGLATINNHGSRFLGPFQSVLQWQDSYFENTQTSLTGSVSVPADELKYISLLQTFRLLPRLTLNIFGSYVEAEPGHTIEVNDVVSDSKSLEAELVYQFIRQRQQNLSIALKLQGKNTNTNILNDVPLIRDQVRTLQLITNYDVFDGLDGFNTIEVNLTQGLDILSAIQPGDPELSRAQAEPEFTKISLSYQRQQYLMNNLLLITRAKGQLASEALFSSQEFGYGGQDYGRPYDPSEITGDHGIAGAVELRYTGLKAWDLFSYAPYIYYDAGKVWNDDPGSESESGTSAGIGVVTNFSENFTGNAVLAFPLTRSISEPLYGNGKNPVLRFGLTYRY